MSTFNTIPNEVLFGAYETPSKGRRQAWSGEEVIGKRGCVSVQLRSDTGFRRNFTILPKSEGFFVGPGSDGIV